MPKRTQQLSSLDVFILFLVRDGIGTLYDLRFAAGLSVGAASPSLRRLQRRGLVAADEKARRDRREYHLTQKAQRVLKSGVARLLEDLPAKGDVQSLLRVAALTSLQKGSSRQLLDSAITRRQQPGSSQLAPTNSRLASLYREMLGIMDTSRREAEISALKKIQRLLRDPD